MYGSSPTEVCECSPGGRVITGCDDAAAAATCGLLERPGVGGGAAGAGPRSVCAAPGCCCTRVSASCFCAVERGAAITGGGPGRGGGCEERDAGPGGGAATVGSLGSGGKESPLRLGLSSF